MNEKDQCTIPKLAEHFHGVSKDTIARWVREMKKDPKFKKAVICPTGRNTIVNYYAFIEFLRYKEQNKFK